jgi:hypothetical protein
MRARRCEGSSSYASMGIDKDHIFRVIKSLIDIYSLPWPCSRGPVGAVPSDVSMNGGLLHGNF